MYEGSIPSGYEREGLAGAGVTLITCWSRSIKLATPLHARAQVRVSNATSRGKSVPWYTQQLLRWHTVQISRLLACFPGENRLDS